MAEPCPRIVAAPIDSGVGKTTVRPGPVSALNIRRLRVHACKNGPELLAMWEESARALAEVVESGTDAGRGVCPTGGPVRTEDSCQRSI